MKTLIELAERGVVPDPVIRLGIRRLLRKRLRDEQARRQDNPSAEDHLIQSMRNSSIALHTREANEQHYEVPAEFFERALGSNLKYSACFWPDHVLSLDQAEREMLELTAARAQLSDGQDVLELGCGWGSLTLWMAENYPNSRILAVSNSRSQREFILSRARNKGLNNIDVLTCDVNRFQTDRHFDRVISIEMFEHVRNWMHLLNNIAHWLKPDGSLFMHVFAHRRYAYFFETEGEDNWMGRYFFTGGLMPSVDLIQQFNGGLSVEQSWIVNGMHYAHTAEAWLTRTDENRRAITKLFASTYGDDQAPVWFHRWRIFFMACAELFAYDQGREWVVAHYRLQKLS